MASVMPQNDELHAGSPHQSVHSESILLLPGGGLEVGHNIPTSDNVLLCEYLQAKAVTRLHQPQQPQLVIYLLRGHAVEALGWVQGWLHLSVCGKVFWESRLRCTPKPNRRGCSEPGTW
jgi:hypothetical protein